LLVTVVPKLSRIAVLINPSNQGSKPQLGAVQSAALKGNISVLALDAANTGEIEVAMAAMQRERVQALLVLPDAIYSSQVELIARLALAHRLPSSYVQNRYPEVGGLLSYGQDYAGNWRLGAKFIDRIFKGANPGDIPFEQPTTFELVLNMKTARTLGLKIPQEILLQATKVIE
jgi:putative ABC transport system substrate-binding protein